MTRKTHDTLTGRRLAPAGARLLVRDDDAKPLGAALRRSGAFIRGPLCHDPHPVPICVENAYRGRER